MYAIANDELYHHGILGMKWGIRRFQSYAENPRKSGKKGKEVGEAKKDNKKQKSGKKKEPDMQKRYATVAKVLAATAAVSLAVAAAKTVKSKGGATKALEELIQSRAKNIASEKIDPLRNQAKKLWPAGIYLDGSKDMENNFTKLTGAQVRAQRQRSFKLGDKKPNGITKKTFNEYRGDKRRKELKDTLESLAKERKRDERRANNVKEYLEYQKKLGLVNDEILEKIKKRGEEIVGHKLERR